MALEKEILPVGFNREGTFQNGKLSGQGKIIFSNGSKWDGEFINGVMKPQRNFQKKMPYMAGIGW
jgi:hypothetical protein